MIHHPNFTQLYIFGQSTLERVVGHIRWSQNQRARGRTLIVGAGTGLDIPTLGPEVTDIVLLEPDLSMRSYLSKKYPHFAILSDPAEGIGAGDGSFDTVITSLVLCTVASIEQTVNEIYRVLKPRGTYLFMEHVRHHGRWTQGIQDTLNPVWKRVAGGCNINRDITTVIRQSPLEMVDCSLAMPNFLIPIVIGSAIRPE